MESMQYAEALVKEFLLFRGFTHTLRSFDAEVEADIGHGLQIDRIVDLLFTVYVPRFEADNMINLMSFLQKSFFSAADARYNGTVRKLENSLKKYYIVHAVQKGRPDRVLHFFERYGDALLKSGDDWHDWFAIPYMKNSSIDPRFCGYFQKEWLDTLIVSFRNFLSEVFDSIRLPTLVTLHAERKKTKGLKQELEKFQADFTNLQKLLQAKDEEILKLKSEYQSAKSPAVGGEQDDSKKNSTHAQPSLATSPTSTDCVDESVSQSPSPVNGLSPKANEVQVSEANEINVTYAHGTEIHSKTETAKSEIDATKRWDKEEEEEEVPQVDVESQVGRKLSQDTQVPSPDADSPLQDQMLLVLRSTGQSGYGHQTQPHRHLGMLQFIVVLRYWPLNGRINLTAWNSRKWSESLECGSQACCVRSLHRYYISKDSRAEVQPDRVVIFVCSFDKSRDLDISHGPHKDVMCRSDVVFDLKTKKLMSRNATQGVEAIGFGSLTVWNMRSWKLMNILPLGEDPPVVTSVCFNHNGKLVAAGATDGMIRLFDMNGCLPITGWPAHDGCAVSSVRFGHDHSSIYSMGSDGKVLEWSLHNQGQILHSFDASKFCSVDGSKIPRHEMALDAFGKNLLLSSNLHSAPVFRFNNGSTGMFRTLNHNGAVTSVDWHPLLPMFLTGSADHSVRVTSIL